MVSSASKYWYTPGCDGSVASFCFIFSEKSDKEIIWVQTCKNTKSKIRDTKYEIWCENVGLHVRRDTVVHVEIQDNLSSERWPVNKIWNTKSEIRNPFQRWMLSSQRWAGLCDTEFIPLEAGRMREYEIMGMMWKCDASHMWRFAHVGIFDSGKDL